MKNISAISHREETNSAIGTWSGFIYQGLCGILVVLRLLNDDKERYKGYSLQLDAYEDFSIFNEHGKIVSLHQCKSVKNQKNYDDEFDKMRAKFEGYKDKGLLHDAKHTMKYFHGNCHVDINAGYGITAYPFENQKDYCEPGHLQELLNHDVSRLKTDDSNTDAVRAALETLINGEVLEIQQGYFNAPPKVRLSTIARNQRIPFAQFLDILATTFLRYQHQDFLLEIKKRYICQMEEKAEDEVDEVVKGRAKRFVERFNNLSEDELRAFIQRINPMEKLDDTHDCLMNMASKERINNLYNLIAEFPVDGRDIHWQTENSLQTPSTLGHDETKNRICKRVYENQANLDLPWIYDWMVGDVKEHVDDIEAEANVITNVERVSNREKSIFQTKKVGILTTDEKRNGQFD